MTGEGFAQQVRSLVLVFPNNSPTAALGNAGVGLIGSGQAIFYNPAGLAFMEGREAYFTYVTWFSGIENYVAGVSANVPRIGTFGFSAVNFDNTNENESEYAISGAYAFNITRRIAVGATVKLAHHDYSRAGMLYRENDIFHEFQDGIFHEYPDSTEKYVHNFFLFDVGAYSVGIQNLVLSLSVHNLSARGLDESALELSEIIRLGVLIDLMSLMDMRSLPHTLDLVMGVNTRTNFDGPVELNMGVEYTYLYRAADHSIGVSLRAGRRSQRYWRATNPTVWGGGLQFKTNGGGALKMDYARKAFYYRSEVPGRFIYTVNSKVHILSLAFNF
ncbi:MAG: hypothetical protein F4Y39_09785 [Gemmatimonadetes bacterium]|nr:hypothetical protein [Gemmatimonadota bacterium]